MSGRRSGSEVSEALLFKTGLCSDQLRVQEGTKTCLATRSRKRLMSWHGWWVLAQTGVTPVGQAPCSGHKMWSYIARQEGSRVGAQQAIPGQLWSHMRGVKGQGFLCPHIP